MNKWLKFISVFLLYFFCYIVYASWYEGFHSELMEDILFTEIEGMDKESYSYKTMGCNHSSMP